MKLWSEIVLPQEQAREPIVFLHGTGCSSRMWKKQVSFFSQIGHPCYSLDLRGHGSSHEPYEVTDLQTHISDIEQTLQACQVSFPAYFVGHSLGSIISIFMANQHPDKVKSIFAAALPGKIAPLVNESFLLFIKGPMQALKRSEIKHYLGWREQALIETPRFTLEQISKNFADIDLVKSIPSVKCPVHLACGRFDPVARYSHIKEMQKQIPNSTLIVFEWAGHNFMDASPQAFNAWMMRHMVNS